MGTLIEFPVPKIDLFSYIVIWSWPGEELQETHYDSKAEAEEFVVLTLYGEHICTNEGGTHYSIDFGCAATIKKVYNGGISLN